MPAVLMEKISIYIHENQFSTYDWVTNDMKIHMERKRGKWLGEGHRQTVVRRRQVSMIIMKMACGQ